MPPGKEQCFIYSAAMLLNLSAEDVIAALGHDGMVKAWKDLPYPRCFKGVHYQEIQDLCLARGKILATIEAAPQIGHDQLHSVRVFKEPRESTRFLEAIDGRPGLLSGRYNNRLLPQEHHCVAWDGKRIFDPNDKIMDLDRFDLQYAWLLCDAPPKNVR